MALLGDSWPHQPAIYDVRNYDLEGGQEDIIMHTELDPLREPANEGDEEESPDIFFMPSYDSEIIQGDPTDDLVDLTTNLDFDCDLDIDLLDDSFCLEDSVVELFRDPDLYKVEPSPTANPNGKEVVSMREDEYLYLGYKKHYEYPSKKIEMSYFRLLQIIHNEHFDTLGYSTWRDMKKKGLVEDRRRGRVRGSDTDSASEGEPVEEDESDLDWEEIFENRRFEAAKDLKVRLDNRREQERRQADVEKQWQKELNRSLREKKIAVRTQGLEFNVTGTPKVKMVGSSKELSKAECTRRFFRRGKKLGRPPGSLNKPKCGVEVFVVLDVDSDNEDVKTPRKRCRQPKSWEEFDKLFERLNCTTTLSINEVKPRRVLHSDRGIIGHKKRIKSTNVKLKAKTGKVGFKARMLKSSGKNNVKLKRLLNNKSKRVVLNTKKNAKDNRVSCKTNNNKSHAHNKLKVSKQPLRNKLVTTSAKRKGKVGRTKNTKEDKKPRKGKEDGDNKDENSEEDGEGSEDNDESSEGSEESGDSSEDSDDSSEDNEENSEDSGEEDNEDEGIENNVKNAKKSAPIKANRKQQTVDLQRHIQEKALKKKVESGKASVLKVALARMPTKVPKIPRSNNLPKDRQDFLTKNILKVSVKRLENTASSAAGKVDKQGENSEKENHRKMNEITGRVLENGCLLSVNLKEDSRTTAGEIGASAGNSENIAGGKRPRENDDLSTVPLPKRTRRLVGGSADLASQRKARMDY